MLIEFSVENFRSIKEKVTLSMVATKDTSLEENIIKNNVLKDDNLLKSAVIFGANASGKTNVVLALNFLKMLVLNSHTHQKGIGIRFTPFKLDKNYISKPTKFGVVFIASGIKYVYEVSFDSKRIVDECLSYYPNDREALIFERKDTDTYRFTIDEKDQKFIAKRTLENMLYLSKATQENYGKTSGAFEWFKDKLSVIGATERSELTDYTVNLLKSKEWKELILKALSVADLGIEDISADDEKIPVEELQKGMPTEITNLVNLIVQNKKEIGVVKIQTKHKGIAFDFFQEESAGTQRFFSLIGPWLDALKKGHVLVIDELDIKLHHYLTKFLINLFHNPIQNKINAQLIFTTHNTNLIDQDLFRRDQIWITEKEYELGSTKLYSIVEYSPRKDADIEKAYLGGKYGGLPFIKKNEVF